MSSRRESSISSHLLNVNIRSRHSSTSRRRSSITDIQENKQLKQEIPAKILVVNGKCSDIFKSTLEDCVEHCILEFPGENSIYVSKPGHSKSIPAGSKQTSINYSREHSSSAKLHHRKTSANQLNLPLTNGKRASQTSNISLATATLSTTTALRTRHSTTQQRFSLAENISEEIVDLQKSTEQLQNPIINEPDSENRNLLKEEISSHHSNVDILSRSQTPLHRKMPSASAYKSYRDRKKDYLLSDLVMLGPEYFTHVFNLPRTTRTARPRTQASTKQQRSTSQQRYNKTIEQYNEFDQIKQDLFHRYLWTQKPQVSCRIRPMTTYTRSTTSVI
ncbi:unnamed protein product [Adineta steineri]|uniref:Uncharacterized protein n=1 Tax=Adineta steineri TaxID=433720 RepID=A0A814T7U2_9BILA|nr:unnamed protein product [Adineta steineri]CAF3636524.1 unnamed protein product [Adineta steineri]